MTTAPTTRPSVPPAARRAAPPSPPAGAGTASIDPFKLLLKYQWLLIASVVIGGVLGVATHVVWIRTFPFWKANVVYQVFEPQVEIGGGPTLGSGAEDELARFMATEIAVIKSPRVLEAAAGDPRLQREAPSWSAQFLENGVFNSADAALELQESISAHVIPGTQLMSMSMTWFEKEDVAGIVSIVNDAYLRDLRLRMRSGTAEERDAIRKEIDDFERQIARKSRERDAMLKEAGIDSLDDRVGSAQNQSALATEQLANLTATIEGALAELQSLEAELASPAGPTYPDTMRQEVESSPLILNIKQTIQTTEAQLNMLRERGFGNDHRNVRSLKAQISGAEQKLQQQRERMLMDAFQTRIDLLRQTIRSLRAQEADALKRFEEAKAQMNDLLQLQAKVGDISREIERLSVLRQEYLNKSANYAAISSLEKSNRVTVLEPPKVPSEVSFPQIYILAPAGVVVMVGLVGGIVLLRELLDQRVRSPADIALIPRTNVVGVVPHASEDPSAPKAVEAVFVDHPRCAIAESFRQIRASVAKRMQEAGHRSLLIVSSMPESGASTVLWNLAAASASADQRVLVIDANFRRPRLYTIAGVPEAPGLADVLSGKQTLDSAVQSSVARVDVLGAGTREERVFERLAADRMRTLIADAGARYDLVLIDVAPAVVSGDAFELANRCDATLLVARALAEKRGLVARIKGQLDDSRADFLGVVVNGVRASAGGYFKRNIRATHRYQNGD